MNRIKNRIVDINDEKVLEFFEERAKKFRDEVPYASILYQDKKPDIAIKRDRYEKERVISLFDMDKATKILDIGCGVGRWADRLAEKAGHYTGVDISPKLIEIARERNSHSHVSFMVERAENIAQPSLRGCGPFDLIIMSGIMIYLNDEALLACLKGVSEVASQNCCVYMREPLAILERLTLSEFWSDELQQNYSAIYRSQSELENIFSQTLYNAGFSKIQFEPLYADPELNNRRETVQHFAISRRVLKP